MKSANAVKLVVNKETREKLMGLAITTAKVWNVVNWLSSLCGEAHKSGHFKRGLFKCPHIGRVINADLNGTVNILHIPESLGLRGQASLNFLRPYFIFSI